MCVMGEREGTYFPNVVSSALQCIHVPGFPIPRARHGDLTVCIDKETHDALRCLGLALREPHTHTYIHPRQTEQQREHNI